MAPPRAQPIADIAVVRDDSLRLAQAGVDGALRVDLFGLANVRSFCTWWSRIVIG
jgi:hypothetical protein